VLNAELTRRHLLEAGGALRGWDRLGADLIKTQHGFDFVAPPSRRIGLGR